MTKQTSPEYDSEGFDGAHQSRGLNPAATKFLERKGALKKKAPEPDEKSDKPAAKTERTAQAKSSRGRTSQRDAKSDKPAAQSSRRKKTAPPEHGTKERPDDLPRRSRKARSLQGRHFRLPLDVDAKLKDLVDYYEGTMVWVICKLIQDEWVRTRRLLRREETVPAEADAGEPPVPSQEQPE